MSTQALTNTAVLTAIRYERAETTTRAMPALPATQTALLEAAYRQVTEYRRQEMASAIALSNAWLAITFFTTNESATPQIGLDGDGGVETEWLVDGHALVVNSLSDGSNVLWALEPDGRIPFRAEFAPRFMAGDGTVVAAEAYLRDLSRMLSNRVRR